MNPLFAAAVDVQAFCASRRWRSTVIGGLSVQRWGEPRQTRDVDLTLITGIGDESRFVEALLTQYQGRIPDAHRFALERRVLLLESAAGIAIDVSLGALPFEERVVHRSSEFAFDASAIVRTCSAEDLVVLKAFADRPQDWLDVEGILARQGPAFDRELVVAELLPLLELKEDATPYQTLQRLYARQAS